MSDPVVVLAAVLAPVLLCVTAALAAMPFVPRSRGFLGGAEATVALAGLAAGVLFAGTGDLARLIAVSGAAAAGGVVVAALVRGRGGTRGARVASGLVAAVVVALIATVQLAVAPPLLEQTLGAVDLGGALPRLVAPAEVAFGMVTVWRGVSLDVSQRAAASRSALVIRAVAVVIVAALAVAAGAIASERSADTVPSILIGAIIGALLGAVCWMLVVRIAGRAAHPADPVFGALVGAAAVLLVLPALVPVAMVATAVAAGLAGGAVRGSSAPLRGALAGLIVGIAAGGIIVGLLADGIGFAATGGLGQSLAQILAVAGVGALSAAAGAGVGAIARLTERRSASREPAHTPRNDDSPGEPGL